MQSALRLILCGAILLAPPAMVAQEEGLVPRTTSAPTSELDRALPDAPVPQLSAVETSEAALSGGDFDIAGQSSSSSQQPSSQETGAKQPQSDDARKKAQQQINEQE